MVADFQGIPWFVGSFRILTFESRIYGTVLLGGKQANLNATLSFLLVNLLNHQTSLLITIASTCHYHPYPWIIMVYLVTCILGCSPSQDASHHQKPIWTKIVKLDHFPQVGMKIPPPVLSISRFPRVVLHLHQKMTQVFFCLMIKLSPNSGNKKRPWKTATCYVNYVTTDDDKQEIVTSTSLNKGPSLSEPIPASSKWPFDSPIGGHLSPEKVTYWFKRGHFEEPGIYNLR